MRRLRWKKRYLTGDERVDARNRLLVDVLSETDAELRSTEHCQDMDDLYVDLVNIAERRLTTAGESENPGPGSDPRLHELLETSLPLEALDTPACRDCDACEHLGDRLTRWLGHGTDPQRSERS
jgi:hypothetical protein